MPDVQVTCITKSDRNNRHESISHIGGLAGPWKWTVSQVIQSIRTKTNTFYTLVNGNRAEIAIVDGAHPYLRTHADSAWNDNLLALPECPK